MNPRDQIKDDIGEHFATAWNRTAEAIDNSFSVVILGTAWLLITCGLGLQKFNAHWRDEREVTEKELLHNYPTHLTVDNSVR